jgi:hypothetical protein
MRKMEELPEISSNHPDLQGVHFGFLAITDRGNPVFMDFVGDLEKQSTPEPGATFPKKFRPKFSNIFKRSGSGMTHKRVAMIPFKRNIRMMNALTALNTTHYAVKPFFLIRVGDPVPSALSISFGTHKLSISGWGQIRSQLLLVYLADRANLVPKDELLAFAEEGNPHISEFCTRAGISIYEQISQP